MHPLARLPIAALALSAAACVIAPYDHYYDHYGTATFTWTVGGSADPSRCDAAGAPLVRVVLEDSYGVVADDLVACRWLGAQYVLEHGWYTATLSLADARGADVDGVRGTGPFYVSGGSDTLVAVDLSLPLFAVLPATKARTR